MEKLRFDFAVKTSADEIICITSIGTPTGKVFGIPDEYQPASLQQVIINTSNYAKVRKTLNKRHQTRKIWMPLTNDISRSYLDEGQNIQFNDFYQEEIMKNINDYKSLPSSSNQTLEKLKEKILCSRNLMAEMQMLSNRLKISTKNVNASILTKTKRKLKY
ncbi:hypothetical protein WA026_022205 [Henosepilachna vigintioctopunctata]|uniref:Uncharacterized protein n=1 Tax=Henosepilachna vigintioctopunctata TaxID=420089 RepID=A0AAW1UPA1_9CUCU